MYSFVGKFTQGLTVFEGLVHFRCLSSSTGEREKLPGFWSDLLLSFSTGFEQDPFLG